MPSNRPLILGIGGTTRENSSSEAALRFALRAAEAEGARTAIVAGAGLMLPMYDPMALEGSSAAQRLVALMREAAGIVISTPGYHGSFSGMIKNALDYAEELRADPSPYLDGKVVGMIVCAYGWQATGTTLTGLRSVVHALRGWPTPLGVSINTSQTRFTADGGCSDDNVSAGLTTLARQVTRFAARDPELLCA